ncbi:hypothetical protein PHLGIDRAFT_126885 [Phlebiopsis gigantea 11061_1 CR5-6]|uniref:Uncharacterized protein n=1 Tax=Phlebiopsis gigantea (strain 11061_1 CR5-6) TaxID=745531 RepID=A0A0C3S102_PHLG1|nr:hypothetical protein PHLGIDRAFT_126885 [Phlebiopsis gigantea 11061_1 CR5-6]
MADAYTIIGLLTGAFGLTAAAQLVWSYISAYLPSQLLLILEETTNEVQYLHDSGLEDNLLPEKAAEDIETQWAKLFAQLSSLRAEVYIAYRTRDQLGGLLNGLSWRVWSLNKEMSDLRSTILTRVEAQKVQLEVEHKPLPPAREPYLSPATRRKRTNGFKVYPPFGSFAIPPESVVMPRPP